MPCKFGPSFSCPSFSVNPLETSVFTLCYHFYRFTAGPDLAGAWGPAIGVGDGRGALPCPPPHKKIQEKYFSVKHRPNVKFGHFRTNFVCRIQEFCKFWGKYDVKISDILFTHNLWQKCLAPYPRQS